MALDTHREIETLKKIGTSKELAEAIVKLYSKNQEQLVTRSDMQELKSELKGDIQELRHELKSDMQKLRHDMQELRSELKSDMQELRSELKSDMQELKSELKTDIAEIKTDILKWTIPMFVTTILTIIAVAAPLWFK